VVDWSRRTRHAPNATVIDEIDVDGFFALLTDRLGRLPLCCGGAGRAQPAR
jgi:inosine-uridine nucleoside N-ribohydrolase